MNAPVSIETSNRYFANALSFNQLKNSAGIRIQIMRKDNPKTICSKWPDGYLTSDTILWMSPEIITTNKADTGNITISFCGYAHCPVMTLLKISDQTVSLSLLLTAICSGIFSFFFQRKKERSNVDLPTENEKLITFGNLSLCCIENCFYDEHRNRLKLTPLQYALMRMFYLSPSRSLSKTDICQSLWPGKENAEETLYTLVRRLKPIIEANSNLRITTDRGRAYGIETMA